MATAVVSGIIDINNLGTPFDDLALKVYSGLVLGAYNQHIVTGGRHVERNISSGKSAQFPITGRVGSGFHTRGTELTFLQMNNNERVISIQDLLVSPVFIDILDEAKSHFNVRSEIAVQQGQELAEQADGRVLRCMVAASRTATPNFTGGDGGVALAVAAMDTSATVLKAGIYDSAETFDEHNLPNSERTIFMAPAQFYLLLQDGEFIDRDFGGDGSKATARMTGAANFELVMTNNLPTANDAANTALPTELRLDYTDTVAVASHKSSAGSVTLIGLGFESEYDMNRQGTMMVAKYAKGFGILRPESAVEMAKV